MNKMQYCLIVRLLLLIFVFTHKRPGIKLSLSIVKKILCSIQFEKNIGYSPLNIIVNNFNSVLVQFTCILLVILAHRRVNSCNCWNTMLREYWINTPWRCGWVVWSHLQLFLHDPSQTGNKKWKLVSGAHRIFLVY